MKTTHITAEQEFVERLGLLTEADGLPRIAGRIMGYLMLSPTARLATEIAADLKISHGSVSTNTRLLERLSVIERTTIPGERASYYRMTNDPYGSILAGHLERSRRMSSMVSDARKRIGADNETGRARLAEMARFYRIAVRMTEDLLVEWEKDQAHEAEERMKQLP